MDLFPHKIGGARHLPLNVFHSLVAQTWQWLRKVTQDTHVLQRFFPAYCPCANGSVEKL